jgi:hypothetical protein
MKRLWLPALMAALVAAGCSKDTCKADDGACLLGSMTWSDFNDDPSSDSLAKPAQTLTPVDLAVLQQRAATALDGGLQLAPVSRSVSFNAGDDLGGLVGLSWVDPLGCRPALCMSACPHGVRCTGARCAPSMRDGITSATTLHWVKFEKASDDPQDLDLQLFAVSAPGCPADVTAALAGTDALAIAGPITIALELNQDEGTTSGTTSGTGTTGTSGGNCPGGFEASTVLCAPLGADGSCSCGGASDRCVSNSEYDGTGFTSPGQCNPEGGGGCLDGPSGVLVKPCCAGLRCVASSVCGGDTTPGGRCMR